MSNAFPYHLVGREDDLVMLFGEAQIVEIGNVARQAIGAHGQHALVAFAAHFGLAVGFHFLRVGIAVAVVGLIACHFGACIDLAFTGAAVFVSMDRVVRRNAAGEHVIVEEGKGQASVRRIRVDDDAAAMLRRRVAGKQPADLVFTTPVTSRSPKTSS